MHRGTRGSVFTSLFRWYLVRQPRRRGRPSPCAAAPLRTMSRGDPRGLRLRRSGAHRSCMSAMRGDTTTPHPVAHQRANCEQSQLPLPRGHSGRARSIVRPHARRLLLLRPAKLGVARYFVQHLGGVVDDFIHCRDCWQIRRECKTPFRRKRIDTDVAPDLFAHGDRYSICRSEGPLPGHAALIVALGVSGPT